MKSLATSSPCSASQAPVAPVPAPTSRNRPPRTRVGAEELLQEVAGSSRTTSGSARPPPCGGTRRPPRWLRPPTMSPAWRRLDAQVTGPPERDSTHRSRIRDVVPVPFGRAAVDRCPPPRRPGADRRQPTRSREPSTSPGYLLAMDGGWFRAHRARLVRPSRRRRRHLRVPVLPPVSGRRRRAHATRVPSTVALAGLSWVGALARDGRRPPPRDSGISATGAARLTPWVIALAPGGLSLILGYSDAFYLAALIWARPRRRPASLVARRRCWPPSPPRAGRTA